MHKYPVLCGVFAFLHMLLPQAIRSRIVFAKGHVARGWPVGQETNRGCLPFFERAFSIEEKISLVGLPTNE
ncbi:hypothetical protein, partial [Terrimonas ferruginea]|uniref:hypothetical protein n=1 Tax=Terrimonas ferruginea TaxID=249 RepID=UPI001B7FBFD9